MQSLFLGSSSRSINGLTAMTTEPSRKSNLPADRPVTTTLITRSASGDTRTMTYADDSTEISTYYLDGQIKAVSGTAVPDKTYD